MDESIFPEKISDSMQVDDFSFTYYNPWDVEYVGYHTVKYSQDEYEKELARLSEKNQDEYKGLFEVKDKPEKYSILEMNLDKYLPKQYQLKGMDVSKRN